jgi:hypothetical protein
MDFSLSTDSAEQSRAVLPIPTLSPPVQIPLSNRLLYSRLSGRLAPNAWDTLSIGNRDRDSSIKTCHGVESFVVCIPSPFEHCSPMQSPELITPQYNLCIVQLLPYFLKVSGTYCARSTTSLRSEPAPASQSPCVRHFFRAHAHEPPSDVVRGAPSPRIEYVYLPLLARLQVPTSRNWTPVMAWWLAQTLFSRLRLCTYMV